MNDLKKFVSNVSVTLISQVFIMLASIIISLFLPKFVSVENYSLWQVFVFYSSYTGVLFLGVNDGYVMRYAGKDYSAIDKNFLFLKVLAAMIFQIIVAGILGIFTFVTKADRAIIWISLLIYMILQNIYAYVGAFHQSANNNRIFSFISIIERIVFLVLTSILIFGGKRDYTYFIFANLISVGVSLLYIIRYSKLTVKIDAKNFKKAFKDNFKDFKIGIKIMVANLSSSMMIGGGRMIIDAKWDIVTFGKISLAISVLQLVLTFVSKISIVVFPAMKTIAYEKANTIYKKIYEVICMFMPLILMAYFPIKCFIEEWLPNYSESIVYLAILLPICGYESIMNIVYTTFLKSNRLENKLLFYNVVSFLVFLFLSGIVCLIDLKVEILLFFIMLCTVIREILTSKYVLHCLEVNHTMQFANVIFVVLFYGTVFGVKSDALAVGFLATTYIVFVVIRMLVRRCRKQAFDKLF